MKKFLALLFALTFIFVLASCNEETPSDSQGDKSSDSQQSSEKVITFTLQNTTDFSYKSVTVSASEKNKWSDNLLVETIKPYASATIKINLPTNTEEREFDLLATDTNGKTTKFLFLNLSEATEKGGTISLYINEGGGAHAYFEEPYNEPTLTIDSTPTKLKYKVGEGYDPAGFSATYTDEDGVSKKISAGDVKFVVSNTVEITAGRAFVSAGKKVVVVEYMGLKQQFELVVE